MTQYNATCHPPSYLVYWLGHEAKSKLALAINLLNVRATQSLHDTIIVTNQSISPPAGLTALDLVYELMSVALTLAAQDSAEFQIVNLHCGSPG